MKKIKITIVILILLITNTHSQIVTDHEISEFRPYSASGINFIIHNGRWGGTVPAQPVEDHINVAGSPFTSTAVGVCFNYRIFKILSIYFDYNKYDRKTQVAYAGSYASSIWIFEQSGYTSHLVGPFQEDAYYKVKTQGLKVGMRGYIWLNKPIDPWFGIYWGYYIVDHGVYNKKNTAHWGRAINEVTGIFPINAGVDFWDKSRSVGLSFFVELTAPGTRNYKIENCLVDGWTFEDYGEGEPIFGHNRIGVSLLTAFSGSSKSKKVQESKPLF